MKSMNRITEQDAQRNSKAVKDAAWRVRALAMTYRPGPRGRDKLAEIEAAREVYKNAVIAYMKEKEEELDRANIVTKVAELEATNEHSQKEIASLKAELEATLTIKKNVQEEKAYLTIVPYVQLVSPIFYTSFVTFVITLFIFMFISNFLFDQKDTYTKGFIDSHLRLLGQA